MVTINYSILPYATNDPNDSPKNFQNWKKISGNFSEAIATAVSIYLEKVGPITGVVTVFLWVDGSPMHKSGAPESIQSIVFDCERITPFNPNLN